MIQNPPHQERVTDATPPQKVVSIDWQLVRPTVPNSSMMPSARLRKPGAVACLDDEEADGGWVMRCFLGTIVGDWRPAP